MKPIWICAAALVASAGIAAAETAAPAAKPVADTPAAASPAPKAACPVAEYAMALRWQQSSGEAEALQRQAYVLARLRLDEALAKQGDDKLAIVTDLDETVIDNSALLVRDVAACHDFSGWDTWKDWERKGNPTLIPGAKEFLDYADSKGVAIFYISDRYDETKESTLKTLTELGLPQVSADHVLLLGPPKGERRALVEKDHRIVMLLGDTLHDFQTEFEGKDAAPQKARVAETADRFGVDWIVLPNPTYGDFSKSEMKGWDAPIVTE
ncbi:MAG TPA: 5'-nucleotidase, lipoprotein e(P4) family [Paracoccus sp. (in: a-proteobacteria)]|nr:5'-nucleotidase, lipoprotein e(P4) family [Paracoccus sp. (in: a-proteobacteria)]